MTAPDDSEGAVSMWQAMVFGFLGGVLSANGYPHFTRGITKRRYPCSLGNGPVPNFVAGWAALVVAALLFYFAHVGRHPGWSLGSAAAGVLLMGLFHAAHGAFGRPEPAEVPAS
jgi:drug/metabolite transporter (DMT)-like permease